MTDLYPRWVIGSVDLTDAPFAVDADSGVDIGEPDMIVEGITSMLADGDLERKVRDGNRTYVIPLYIEGPTMLDLADAEAVLRAEIRKTGLTLTHDPGDGWAPVSVYEVQTARLTPARDDTHEWHMIRKYTLTLTCGPHARKLDPVTVEALAPPSVSPVTATITNADTTTGFTATKDIGYSTPAVTVTDQGDYVQAQGGDCLGLRLAYATSAVSLASTRYVTVETSGSGITTFVLTVDGVRGPYSPALARSNPSGTVTYVLDTGGGSLTQVELFYSPPGYITGGAVGTINVHDISRTDTLPQITKRQITRIVQVAGTERTPASVHVSAPDGTTNLGMTIVHTSPEDGSGYSPPLRRWRVSGGSVSTDSATMSGGREPIALANPFVAEVPSTSLPEGGYLLAARVRVPAIGTVAINWATATKMGSDLHGYVTDSASIDFPVADNWYWVPIAALTLPSVRSLGGKVWVSMSSTTAELDEAWVFRVDDDCALTVLHAATGPHLWLDSPDVTSSVPRIWVGDDPGRTDASHPAGNLNTHGNHTFAPDAVQIFTATAGVENPEAQLTYYPRYHSNAAS